jgi:hypothetical protein
MTPLIQAPSIIPQLILSLYTVSIATCNKLFENKMPFYGDKAKPRILGLTGNKNFSRVIDTGSAVTCININSFEMAFRKTLPIGKSCNIDIFIKGRKCTHSVIVKDKLSKNTLGVDFIQKHRLHYDHATQQLRFLQTPSKAIFAVKNFTILLLATIMVQARSLQKTFKNQNYVADICALNTPLITGPSSLVTFDNNNHYAIWLQNCAPYKVTIETGDILGIVDTENTIPIPLDSHSIATICNQIYERLPKVKKKT